MCSQQPGLISCFDPRNAALTHFTSSTTAATVVLAEALFEGSFV